MISQDTIASIFDSARVEEVVGDYVTLKKRGVNLIGNCPFHDEKSPSFTVSSTKGIYKCFGCGKAGNSVNFMMDHEQMTYPEALRYLANKYNIEIEEKEQSPEQMQAQSSRESLQIVNSYAQKFFSNQLLNSDEGKSIALSYFKERGYSIETIEKFHLGYNPSKWDSFTSSAIKEGYKEEYLLKAGLTKGEPSKRFDFFKGRVMFPIHNITGRVIAFGGRILTNDKKTAKYFNSPETELYNKSKVLYGLYFAKKDIVKLDNCLLVEGYTDVISMHQRGIENVVSSSGTSLTADQIKLIKRYTPNITILFDGDVAGIKASFRGIDMILKEGLNVKVVLFPDGEDPDSFAKKMSKPEIDDFISTNSKDFIRFKSDLLLDDAKNDPIKKAELVKEILSTVSVITDEVKRSIYMSECSSRFGIAEKALYNELNKILRNNFKTERRGNDYSRGEVEVFEYKEEPKAERKYGETDLEYLEKDLIRLLVNYGEKEVVFFQESEGEEKEEVTITVSDYIVHTLENDEIKFSKSVYQKIFDHYSKLVHDEKPIEVRSLMLNPDVEIVENVVSLSSQKYELSENWRVKHKIYVSTEDMNLKFALEHSVLALQLKKVEINIQDIQNKLKAGPDDEEVEKLLSSQLTYIELKKVISDKLNRVILK
jgi:DNA primase|tara:strand:- start:2413 stop:4371 length:1959 start_codon:yes stop_codon:yes gene_type:complete